MDIFLEASMNSKWFLDFPKSTKLILNDFIFFTSLTIMSLVYINPFRFGSEKPNKSQKKQYYTDFFNVLNKHNIKLRAPKKSL
jgi:hypothetical protein